MRHVLAAKGACRGRLSCGLTQISQRCNPSVFLGEILFTVWVARAKRLKAPAQIHLLESEVNVQLCELRIKKFGKIEELSVTFP